MPKTTIAFLAKTNHEELVEWVRDHATRNSISSRLNDRIYRVCAVRSGDRQAGDLFLENAGKRIEIIFEVKGYAPAGQVWSDIGRGIHIETVQCGDRLKVYLTDPLIPNLDSWWQNLKVELAKDFIIELPSETNLKGSPKFGKRDPTENNIGLPENIEVKDIDSLKFNIPSLKVHYKNFNIRTAKAVLEAIPDMYQTKYLGRNLSQGKFTPKYFEGSGTTPTTGGRYCCAMYYEGLRTVDGIALPCNPRMGKKKKSVKAS